MRYSRFADSDQETCREGNTLLTRGRERLEPAGRNLVRRAEVRPPASRQPVGGRLEHQPHGCAHAPQPCRVFPRHHSGIEMRQEPGLAENSLRRAGDIVERRLTAERLELVTRDPVAQLGLVAECEQRFAAAGGSAGTGDREHFVDRHVSALTAPGRVRERAVVADVAAELRQRDEDLGRIGDQATMAFVA